MSRVPPDDSLPEALRRLKVGQTKALVEKLELGKTNKKAIEDTMTLQRNRANSAISRATAAGRKYHRDSIVILDEAHNPLVTVLITRTA